MADYARLYGFMMFKQSEIEDNEENFVQVGKDNYIRNEDYEMLEEIINKEFS